MLLFMFLAVATASPSPSAYNVPSMITLTPSNTIAINGVVTSESALSWQRKLRENEGDTVYLYINSPGGSVLAGNAFISEIQYQAHQGKNIVCVMEFAASMAFAIMQACPHRAAVPHATGMQHQMSLILGGQLESVTNRLDFSRSLSNSLNRMQAERLGLSLGDFQEKVQHDWWVFGEQLAVENIVDSIVSVGCSNTFKRQGRACPISVMEDLRRGAGQMTDSPTFELWLGHQR
jgi:ATP-dependent Clp protease protease subunit